MSTLSFVFLDLPGTLTEGFYTEVHGEARILLNAAKVLVDAGCKVYFPRVSSFNGLPGEKLPIISNMPGDAECYVLFSWWNGERPIDKHFGNIFIYSWNPWKK